MRPGPQYAIKACRERRCPRLIINKKRKIAVSGKETGRHDGDLQAVLADLEKAGVAVVHVGIVDLDGVFRERRLRLAELGEFAEGATFVNVLPQWDIADQVFGGGPFVGEPIAIDPGSVRPYPFEADAALLVADYSGPSAALSPRELLRAQVAKAAAMGYDVRCAFEFEFIVLEETAHSLREKNFEGLTPFAIDNHCWAGQTAAVHSDFVARLEQRLVAAEVPLHALGVELGPGCFEATLKAGEPVRAADDATFFRLFTKAHCRREGLTASFMAQLGADYPGLSGHIHLSLAAKEQGGANAFADGAREDGLSGVCRAFIAGVVELAPEALALCAHTVNAYRRLTPGNWAPQTASWAPQNYAAAIRAVAEPESRCRLEYRLPASDTNPYLALAMMLGAGLDGIERGAEPPPPIATAGTGEAPPPGSTAAPRLPHDLFEATERLAGSRRARAIFGDAFIDHFVASRRAEEIALRRQVSAAERARYLETV